MCWNLRQSLYNLAITNSLAKNMLNKEILLFTEEINQYEVPSLSYIRSAAPCHTHTHTHNVYYLVVGKYLFVILQTFLVVMVVTVWYYFHRDQQIPIELSSKSSTYTVNSQNKHLYNLQISHTIMFVCYVLLSI